MSISISEPEVVGRGQWARLYHGCAECYRVPMDDRILPTVRGWIHAAADLFIRLIAQDESGEAVGLMRCRQVPSPPRGAMVGSRDTLFGISQARGQGVVAAMYAAPNVRGWQQGWRIIRWITADDTYRGCAVYDGLSLQSAGLPGRCLSNRSYGQAQAARLSLIFNRGR